MNIRLRLRESLVYTSPVAAHPVTGVDSPKHVRRASATSRRFFHACSFYGGLRGEAERSAGVLTGRSVNPALIRHHLFGSSVGGLQSQLGVRSS